MSGMVEGKPWRDVATAVLVAVLAVAAVSVVLDGGRSAFAADDCQYGQYGPYGPYGPYGQYGQQCRKAEPTLTLSGPTSIGVGFTVMPTASLQNGAGPTSTLTFRLYRPGDASCSSPALERSVVVNGNGSYTPVYSTSPFAPPLFDQVGTWNWTVAYAGDARNEPAAIGCGEFAVAVTPRSSGIFINRPPSQPVGSLVTISGGSMFFQPTGTISLRVYGPGDPTCAGAPAFSRQVAPSFFTETIGPVGVVGTWSLRLSYPGDSNNLPAMTPCGGFYSFEVTKATASLSLVLSPMSVTVGQPVTAGASVAGYQPTGTLTIRFFAPSDPLCASAVKTETMPIAGSVPTTTSFVPTSVGTWQVTTEYSGDVSNTPATATCGSLVLASEKATPSVSVSAVPVLAEDRATIGATAALVGGYQPTGTVAFRLFPPSDPTCAGTPAYVEEVPLSGSGAATSTGFVIPKHEVGTWNWSASYLGDQNNASNGSSCGQAPVSVVGNVPRPEPAEPFVANPYFNCLDDHNIAVPLGRKLVLRIGFGTVTERQLKDFLTGIETRLVVDGAVVSGADRFWGKPFLNPDTGFWTSLWVYDTERVLEASTPPFAIEFEQIARKTVTDGVDTWNPGDVIVSSSGPCLVAGVQP